MLTRGPKRQFLATLCRVPKPREYGRIDNVPIFGEGQMLNPAEMMETRALQFYRMGVRGWRSELGWRESADGKREWEQYDRLFAAAEKAGCKIMVTLGGHAGWLWTFGEPTPAAGWRPGSFGYGGTGDWVCKPELYERYGRWITDFCQRYWKGGNGALWGLENYNEPWEGGGISGWARDMLQYRALQKVIATSARRVSPDIKLLAASSIMNTEDKLYSDGSKEFDQYIDIFTDHYVVPPACYGPMVAKAHGKESMETETWFVNSEYLLPQGVAQFMACGQQRLSPWHPRVLFDAVPGANDEYFIPSPVVAATAALNYFVTGKKFEKIVFKEHLPWVFQFGKDDDAAPLLIVFGQLMPIAGTDPKDRLWCQVDGAAGGKMTHRQRRRAAAILRPGGQSRVRGQAERRTAADDLPHLHHLPARPRGRGRAFGGGQDRRQTARRDPAPRLHRAGGPRHGPHGRVAQLPQPGHQPASWPCRRRTACNSSRNLQPVELKAGERKAFPFELAQAAANPENAYPFAFRFTSDAGNAEYKEVLNATIIPKRTIQVDGNLDDWKDIPGVTVVAKAQKAEVTELLRRPWLAIKDAEPQGNFAQFKLAWDENYLYVAALVNDPTPQVTGWPPWPGATKTSTSTADCRTSSRPTRSSWRNGRAAALPRCPTCGAITRRTRSARRCPRFPSAATACTSPWT